MSVANPLGIKEYDQYHGAIRTAIIILAVAWVVFQGYTAFTYPLSGRVQLAVHLGFALPLTFLLYPLKDRGARPWYYLILDAFLIAGALAFTFEVIRRRGLFSPEEVAALSPWHMAVAFIAVVTILESARRVMGLSLVITTLVCIAYVWLGRFLPGMFYYPGLELDRFLSAMYMGEDAIWGSATDISANQIFGVVLLGGFLIKLGGGQAFMDMATAALGRFRGGPAKMAVAGSALFGTISGSVVANVATVGQFTIPLMKRVGYQGYYAAAVEACASNGGAITPPVMGMVAFLIAEFLGISYGYLIVAAAVPAFLYYFCVFLSVDLEAARTGMKGLPANELPSFKKSLRQGWYILLSPLLLYYLLAVLQWSPRRAGFWTVAVLMISDFIMQFFRTRRISVRPAIASMQEGARNMLTIATTCAAVGIIMGAINLTGVAVNFSSFLLDVAGGNVYTLLLMAAVGSIILGMGLPTILCYLVLVIFIAPALIDFGLDPLGVHLFMFYYGIISNLTPPVALASFVAASIAGSPLMKTSWQSMRIGIACYVLPFIFVFRPAILLKGTPIDIITTFLVMLVSLAVVSSAFEAYMFRKLNKLERALLFVASAFLIYFEIVGPAVALIVGLAITGVVAVSQLSAVTKLLLRHGLVRDEPNG